MPKIKEIECEEANLKHSEKKTLFIDVRESDELHVGILSDSLHVPLGEIQAKLSSYHLDKESPIIIYCAGGIRSLKAANQLLQQGFNNVSSLIGGFNSWAAKGFHFENPSGLTQSQLTRYARHLALSEVGIVGQKKLIESKVLVVGAGGLGSPVLYYLAAAGIGNLGVIDDDVVEESNLQRQIIHDTSRIGIAKTESAKKTLNNFNPQIQVDIYTERLNSTNIEDLIMKYDLIVDASDNFETRYLVNDACYKLTKPLVHGSVLFFEGQVSVFDFRKPGPCYRCIFPFVPPAEFAPSCAEAGVFGVLPGVIGNIQAAEVLKILLDIGESLHGRLLTYDALGCHFGEFKIDRNPDCELCSFPPDQVKYKFIAESCKNED